MKNFKLILVFALCTVLYAEDFPFGADDDDDANLIIQEAEKSAVAKDKLAIGGYFIGRFNYYHFNDEPMSLVDAFSSPNQLYLYTDARLRNDTRFYAKANMVYDPTANLISQKYYGNLDELKILFNIYQKAFLTIGKQQIKYGVSKFWNPTDFLNSENKDLLYSDDRRLGVNLIKTHVPLGNSNLYVIQQFDDVAKIQNIGQMLRYELPLYTSELSVSVLGKRHNKTLYGMDYSIGVWLLDLYAETATNGAETKLTTGASYEQRYNYNDTFTISAEYSFNDNSTSLVSGIYDPYNMSKHYFAIYLYLPQPYSLLNWDFILMNITNIDDKSSLARFNITTRIIQDINIDFFVNGHFGSSGTEFKYGGQMLDVGAELRIEL